MPSGSPRFARARLKSGREPGRTRSAVALRSHEQAMRLRLGPGRDRVVQRPRGAVISARGVVSVLERCPPGGADLREELVCPSVQTCWHELPIVDGVENANPSPARMIPGARERDTLTYRQPGSIGGPASGSNVGKTADRLMDHVTIAERQREGGGAPGMRRVA